MQLRTLSGKQEDISMRVFVDSADQKQIENWLDQGVVDGVTTNPSIMFKDGATDLEECARRLAGLLGERPLSVEVTSNDRQTMLEQARTFATWARNIVVKIPIVNEYGESCLGVMHRLSQEGIGVNATAILSFNQALLAAKAGATYVSIFAGRVADEGNDPGSMIGSYRPTLSLAASARSWISRLQRWPVRTLSRFHRSSCPRWLTTGILAKRSTSLCKTPRKRSRK
jgi:transaldolase